MFSSLLLLAPTTLPYDGGAGGAHVTACDAAAPQLPSSISLQDGLEPVVRWMLEHSPTFRQQCRVLSSARLSVSVKVTARPVGTYRRARAFISESSSGAIAAAIEIYPGSDLPELLGHEFEHLIEQLDGIDLGRAAKAGLALRTDDGAFETRRALAAGRRVSGEVADNAPDRVRRAGARLWRAVRRLV